MSYSTTLTSKGQVTIPVEIRRKLGLKPGERVLFNIGKNNQVVIEKSDWLAGLRRIRQENQAYPKRRHVKRLSDEALDDAINAAAEQAATEDYKRSLEQ